MFNKISKKLRIAILTMVIIIVVISSYFSAILIPIFIQNDKVLDLYTSVGNDPYKFASGVNLDTSRDYSIHFCEVQNITKFIYKPRIVVIHSSYETSPGVNITRVNIISYNRESNFLFLDPQSLASGYNYEDYNKTIKKINEYCSIEIPSKYVGYSYDQLLKFKQDAQNPPQIDYNDPKIQQKIKDAQNFNNPTPEELEKINKDFNTR